MKKSRISLAEKNKNQPIKLEKELYRHQIESCFKMSRRHLLSLRHCMGISETSEAQDTDTQGKWKIFKAEEKQVEQKAEESSGKCQIQDEIKKIDVPLTRIQASEKNESSNASIDGVDSGRCAIARDLSCEEEKIDAFVDRMDTKVAKNEEIMVNLLSDEEDCPATQQLDEVKTTKPPSSPTIRCPTCGKNLSFLNERNRLQHVNACLDQLEQFERNKKSSSRQENSVEVEEKLDSPIPNPPLVVPKQPCAVCGIELQGKTTAQRVNHTKQCGRRFGVSVQTIRADEEAAPPPNEDNLPLGNISSTTANAFDMLMNGAKSVAVAASNVSKFVASNNKKRKPSGWNTSSKQTTYSCPQYKMIKGTKIVVDGFQYASKTLSSIYFLTHFHSDHYTGLTKSFSAGIIYCTPVTAKLVLLCLGVNSKYVHPLPLNQPFVLPDQQAQVTLIDANHCPGAALILFQLRGGKTFLHTGDFRYDPCMIENRFLHCYANQSPTLDGVYLDTTYCDLQYCHPTQAVAISEAKRLVDLHANDRALFLFGSYSIGKERLFMDVARHLKQKVYVERSKWSLMACFDWSESEMGMVTLESSITNLHVVPMGDLNFESMGTLLNNHRLRFHKVIAFRPTGWTFSGKHKLSSKREQQDSKLIIYGIPYSEHSSFEELCSFIKAFKPKTIIPTVNCSKTQKQIDLLQQTCFNNITHHFK